MRLPEIHHYGKVFNFVADNIHCWADAEGAQVWEVEFKRESNPHFRCRVMALDESDAEKTAWDWEKGEYPSIYEDH